MAGASAAAVGAAIAKAAGNQLGGDLQGRDSHGYQDLLECEGIKAGDKTPHGREFTTHAAEQATKRKYSLEDVDSIIDGWTEKGYQPGGRTVYVKKNSYGYDVVIVDKNGTSIVSVIGGNAKHGVENTLTTRQALMQMLNNNGGFFSLPIN